MNSKQNRTFQGAYRYPPREHPWGEGGCRSPAPLKKTKLKKPDCVDTISNFLRDLSFGQNQQVKSADDSNIRILKNTQKYKNKIKQKEKPRKFGLVI
jgi:hypothetical protein